MDIPSDHRFLAVARKRLRLLGLFAPGDTPKAICLTSPKHGERDLALELLGRAAR